MFKRSLLTAALLAFGAAAQAGTPVTLGHSPVLTGGDYTTGGGLTVAMEARPIGGQLGLCGVWAQSEAMSVYTRRAAPRILARGVATLNGQVVTRDFGFLNRVRPAANYSGAPANCVVLNRPWHPGDAARLQVRIPRQKVFLTSEVRRKNGPRVFFVRSDSANPALKKGSLLPPSITSASSWGSQ